MVHTRFILLGQTPSGHFRCPVRIGLGTVAAVLVPATWSLGSSCQMSAPEATPSLRYRWNSSRCDLRPSGETSLHLWSDATARGTHGEPWLCPRLQTVISPSYLCPVFEICIPRNPDWKHRASRLACLSPWGAWTMPLPHSGFLSLGCPSHPSLAPFPVTLLPVP